MVAAIQSGSLKHLDTTNEPYQSGHYEQRTGTLHLNTSNFDAKGFDSASARRDNLAVVIGHEAGHALLADASERERYALRYNMGEAIRTASHDGTAADLTGPANRYVSFMRRNEAMAELVGMNALASRATGANGAFDRAEFLRRVDPSTPCVDKGVLASGISLSPAGIQIIGKQFRTSPAIEAVAQCYTDSGASIGQHGDSSYRDTHGTYVMKVAASELNDYAKGTTMHVPAIELDMATLKLDPNGIERAGLDLGGPGRSLSYVDTSKGRREYESVSHANPGDRGELAQAGKRCLVPKPVRSSSTRGQSRTSRLSSLRDVPSRSTSRWPLEQGESSQPRRGRRSGCEGRCCRRPELVRGCHRPRC
jgi:hypothetical protein